MAKSLSPLLFLYLLAFSCSSLLALGIRHEVEQQGRRPIPFRHQGEESDRGNECRIDKINALEPSSKTKSEAGVTEFWDPNEDQFRCAGVAFMRRFIQPDGLLLPYFRSSPELYYVIKGRGIRGMALPGCKETFQSVSRGELEGHGVRDEHQKILRFRQGDVFVLPAGVVQWLFNDGEEDLILVNLIDTNNEINQLDENFPRGFFLAGNPQGEFEEERGQRGQRGAKNILDGMDPEILEEVFGVSREIVESLRSNEDDNRGQIVKAEKLRVIRPPVVRGDEREEGSRGESESGSRGRRGEETRHGGRGSRGEEEWEETRHGGRGSRGEEEWEETRHGGRGSRGRRGSQGGSGCSSSDYNLLASFTNGMETPICALKMRASIDDPYNADIYVPQAGRLTPLTSSNLPVLRLLRLSAERGVLYKNALMAPHWTLNAHNLIYATRGSARVQIVNERGQDIFHGVLRENQLVVAPQNFVLVKQAGDEGFEWVSFKTNDDSMIQTVAGSTSFIKALPVEVVMSSYQISREEAEKLKYERRETLLFAGGSRPSGGRSESERRAIA